MTEFESNYIQIRKKIIAHDFASLNPEQLKAVMATEGPLLILAGAGSGKTTVLINRIACILKYGQAADSDRLPEGADEQALEFLRKYDRLHSPEDEDEAARLCAIDRAEPWQVIAITFTNKAADELINRLERMLGSKAGEVWASTFHSACVRILRRDVEALGIFSRGFTIYDTADSLSLIKRILKDLDIDEKKFAPRSILSTISAAKDEMSSAAAYMKAAGADVWRKTVAQVWEEYTKRMIRADAMDFDDLILYTVMLFQKCPEVLERYQRKFKYVLVDEYQDTNMLQYKLVSLLAGGNHNLCVVGDDDQGIYKFRGATIENILGFEAEFKGARVIKLEQNYRSTATILNAANQVIRVNSKRKGKELWTSNEKGEVISLYTARDENDEAQYVAACMLEKHTNGMAWRDFAVLYRINALSNRLEYALKRNGIPYRIYGGMRFYDRAEIKDMLAYMCVVENPDDELRLRRIINNPPRGIGDTTVDKAAEAAVQDGKTLYAVLRDCVDYPQLRTAVSKIKAFVDIIEDVRAKRDGPLDELYDYLLQRSGYMTMLEAKDTQENITRAENVTELKSNIINFVNERGGAGTLADFLDEMALYSDMDTMDKDADCAALMTVHSAKGLEFPVVFLVGAEDGIFPGSKSIGEQEEMEEERRLCYVAITRAKRKLYIIGAKQRMIFGRTQNNKLSRFIQDVPEECLERLPKTQNAYTGAAVPAFRSRSAYTAPRKSEHSMLGAAPRTKPKSVSFDYKVGDTVSHSAFGVGVVLTLTPMGGDVMAEIAFESEGTRKLMLSFAGKYLKKR